MGFTIFSNMRGDNMDTIRYIIKTDLLTKLCFQHVAMHNHEMYDDNEYVAKYLRKNMTEFEQIYIITTKMIPMPADTRVSQYKWEKRMKEINAVFYSTYVSSKYNSKVYFGIEEKNLKKTESISSVIGQGCVVLLLRNAFPPSIWETIFTAFSKREHDIFLEGNFFECELYKEISCLPCVIALFHYSMFGGGDIRKFLSPNDPFLPTFVINSFDIYARKPIDENQK